MKELKFEQKNNGFIEKYLSDKFFDSLREDYQEFDVWYKKSVNDESKTGYYWTRNNQLIAFIGLKIENEEIVLGAKTFEKKKRIKITTIKSSEDIKGFSEFVIFNATQKAAREGIDEIYFSVIPTNEEKTKLMNIFETYGFENKGSINQTREGIARSSEEIFLFKTNKRYPGDWKKSYPRVTQNTKTCNILPIAFLFHDEYIQSHTGDDYVNPFKRGIKKIYVHNMKHIKNIKEGGIVLIYRMADKDYKSFYSGITAIGMIIGTFEKGKDYHSFEQFKEIIKGNHAFSSHKQLRVWYDRNDYVTSFALVSRLKKTMSLQTMRNHNIWDDNSNYPPAEKVQYEDFKRAWKETNE